MEEINSVTKKKVIRWGPGLGVFITTEAKAYGWDDSTKVKVTALKGKKIIIEEFSP